MDQVYNVGNTTMVQDVWKRRQPLTIRGWIYGISNGLLRNIGVSASSDRELKKLEKVCARGLSKKVILRFVDAAQG